jgi:hypothetical protein
VTLDQFPFRELTSAAGIAAAALLIRQVIEAAKGSLIPWLDANNERKGTFIFAAVLYVAWLAVYGTDLGKDGPAALAAFWACSIAALGTNEAVDAAKGVVAKNVVQTVATDPVVATAATASGVTTGVPAPIAAVAAPAAAVAVDPVVAVDADASTADDGDGPPDGLEVDGAAPLELGPDVDLNVNDGNPLDDEDDDEPLDPAEPLTA